MNIFFKKNIVLIGSVAVFLSGICGCGKEPVFVDADALPMESETAVSYAEEKAYLQMESHVEAAELAGEQTPQIMVHVCGAVVSPGVYELESGSRVIDAVRLAEGFLPQAASDYVNLAAFVSDADRIWIPTVQEAEEISTEALIEDGNAGKININTADEELLCTLPGIGSTRAKSIIAYREQNGSFQSIEDIMNVSGIKDSSFQKIKEYIIVK